MARPELASDGRIIPAHLGTGTADATTFLRGDQTWQTPAGSGDVIGDDTSTAVQNIVAYNTTGGKNITELTGTQGDVLYHTGTKWEKLAAGTAGHFLKTNGFGANPAWAAAGGGSGDVIGDDTSTTVQNIVAYNTTGGKNITELTGTQGDVLYHNGTSWVKLAAGAAGHFLKTNGFAANPEWAAVGALGLTIEWRANGPYIVDTDVDGGVLVHTNMTLQEVRLYRKTAGTSGSTSVQLRKNGTLVTTLTIAFDDADKKVSASISDACVAGDLLTIDTSAVEAGSPADYVFTVKGT